jgi:hypothetical protein
VDWVKSLSWIVPVVSATVVLLFRAYPLLLKAWLRDWTEERKARREESREDREKRVQTDRTTYNRRLAILIRCHLATYVRSGKWFTDDRDLRKLLTDLENGTRERFLDRDVDVLWQALIDRSVLLARKRTTNRITPGDIQEYNGVRDAWEDGAKRSFGPLPETPSLTAPRRDTDRDALWAPATGARRKNSGEASMPAREVTPIQPPTRRLPGSA